MKRPGTIVTERDLTAEKKSSMASAGMAVVAQSTEVVRHFMQARVLCVVIHYNRPKALSNLLQDISRERRPWLHVRVYDDGSTESMGVPEQICEASSFELRRLPNGPHGRERFWQAWCAILAELKLEPANTLFCILPDDLRLCQGFFDRALALWNDRPAVDDGAVNLLADRRSTGSQWTGFQSVRATDNLLKTQWVDGLFLCGHGLLKRIGYSIPPQPIERFENKGVSSGVWRHVSCMVHEQGQSMYTAEKSLAVHVLGHSSMHHDQRLLDPLLSLRFVDGLAAHGRLLATDEVHASLASIPSRVELLSKVVASLLPQVGKLRCYLNGYADVPAFLVHPKITVARSQEHGDLGDAGKFFWCEQADGYELTCDDDLVYPENHVLEMLQAIERYDRKAVVGMHGATISHPLKSYYESRVVSHWNSVVEKDTPVHVLGTGVMAYHFSTVQFRRSDFRLANMADVWAAIACEAASVPRVVVAHKAKCLRYLEPPTTIYDAHVGKDVAQTKAVASVSWKPPVMPKCNGHHPTASAPKAAPCARRPAPTEAPSEKVAVCLDGVKATIECDVGHVITRHIKNTRAFYEQDLLLAIRKLGRKGTYIDVGANIGNHSMWFAMACPSSKVLAYEPSPRYFRLLVNNTASLPKVRPSRLAVGAKNGPIKVSGVTGRPVPDPVLDMTAAPLDQLCADEQDIGFIKVDVDGDDIGVLRGAKELIARCRPAISVESFTDQHKRELAEFCREMSYSVAAVYCYTPTSLLVPLLPKG